MDATRNLRFGLSLLLLGGASAYGQFAVDRPTTPPPATPLPVARPLPMTASPTGFQPATASGFQPASAPVSRGVVPAGGFQPATQAMTPGQPSTPLAPAPLDTFVPSTLTNHPLALKPEHGAYVICVRSYSKPAWVQSGPSALALAEAMANEIRTTQKAPAYLFEHVSEEKKAEFARREQARQEQAPFLKTMDQMRQRSETQGTTFLEPERGRDMIRYKTVRYNDQFAVIIAGFRTDADARKALDIIRKWPIPKDARLLDMGTITKTSKEKSELEREGYINPYTTAFVTPNPTIPRSAAAPASGLDDFTRKLNEDRPYNLLKAKKGWTLAVKQFSAPATIQGANSKSSSTSTSSSATDVFNAGAEMAEQLATMLRGMKDRGGQGVGEEAFVLHTRTGSLVTVGQFESPDDPKLLEARRRLTSMNFTMAEKQGMPGRPLNPQERLFSDNILPIPIPR